MRTYRGVKIASISLGGLVGFGLLLTVLGFWLPSRVEAMHISATMEASSAELFMLFNTRAGQKRLWAHAAERSGPP